MWLAHGKKADDAKRAKQLSFNVAGDSMAGSARDAFCERTAGLMDTPLPDEDVLVALDPLDVVEHVLTAENLQFDRTEDGDLAFALTGDWKEICKADRDANWSAVLEGETRVFSSFDIAPKGNAGKPIKIWVITEWDRSITTVLRPEDY